MKIDLRWTDSNTRGNYRTEIYKATEPFYLIEEATLLASVPKGVTSYLDNDVVQNMIYYYRFRLVNGITYSPLSALFEFEASPYNGPGPKNIAFGDESFGYYGEFPRDDTVVPSIYTVREMLGLTSTQTTLNVYPHKFTIGGGIRGCYGYPIASGSEIPFDNDLIQQLFSGEQLTLALGIHKWRLMFTVTEKTVSADESLTFHPYELSSMIGVLTELYASNEHEQTGNVTGNQLTTQTGMLEFFTPLSIRWPTITPDRITTVLSPTDNRAITWTAKIVDAPLSPAELTNTGPVFDYTVGDNWKNTLIWPILIYDGLVGTIGGTPNVN